MMSKPRVRLRLPPVASTRVVLLSRICEEEKEVGDVQEVTEPEPREEEEQSSWGGGKMKERGEVGEEGGELICEGYTHQQRDAYKYVRGVDLGRSG